MYKWNLSRMQNYTQVRQPLTCQLKVHILLPDVPVSSDGPAASFPDFYLICSSENV